MEVLLLADVPGIGKCNDVIVVGNGFALNHLLPTRKALVVTPNVRKRYADQIKKRGLEREAEKSNRSSTLGSLKDKTVGITSRASKTGKLYAAITSKMVAEALAAQHGVSIGEQYIRLDEPVKTAGKHTITVKMGDMSAALVLDVKGDEKTAKA